ncbi:MAG: putative proteasome-type protease [Paracoccaceae bacterium]|jgi:putative proteasome-type protease
MTYCLGILLKDGIVMAADSRTNAGVDYISTFRKLTVFEKPGERVMALATAGNLATSQAVTSLISERLGEQPDQESIFTAKSMFEVARIVGRTLHQVIRETGKNVRDEGGDASATFILGGQIKDRSPRLFLIYAAGNFIEATAETPFLQIGENKYGKPILDRTINQDMPIERAITASLVSFESTMRSNLSVGLPIDLITILAGKQRVERHVSIEEGDLYFTELGKKYGDGIVSVFENLPDPDVTNWPPGPSC